MRRNVVEMGGMQAVILAGGEGKRMGLLCQTRPKPSLPFAGTYRVIDFPLSNCVCSVINDISVLTDYRRSQMSEYINRWQAANGRATNIRVLEPRAGSYEGTADAVYQNLKNLERGRSGTVLVLAGDHVYNLDYRKMLAHHRATNADVTIGVVTVPIDQAKQLGTVTLDADSRITGFEEKSPAPRSNLASMGIYIFNKDFLETCLTEDARNPESRHDFGYSLLPKVVKQHRAYAYLFNDYWLDIGTIETYYQANMELTRDHPAFSLKGMEPALAPYLKAPCISKQSSIKNSIISPGCAVRGRVENSIISPRVWIDEHAVVRNSIVMENTFIGPHAIIDGCILDEDVNIAGHCYIGFGPRLSPGETDITVVGCGVSIPQHTAIGRGCRISPRVSPSDFPATAISRGTVVNHTDEQPEERKANRQSLDLVLKR